MEGSQNRNKFVVQAGVGTNVLSKNNDNQTFMFYVFSSHFCEIKVQICIRKGLFWIVSA